MRDKLALIIALAGFAAVTALGVGIAGAQSAGLGEGQAADPIPGATLLPRRTGVRLRQRSR